MKHSLTIILLLLFGAVSVHAEQVSESVGAERARLGNARIQQDIERRAKEEQQRAEEMQQATAQPQEAAQPVREASAPPSPPAAPPPPGESDMSETLELLRTLGELKDAGYVTQEEYDKLKQKVLADQL